MLGHAQRTGTEPPADGETEVPSDPTEAESIAHVLAPWSPIRINRASWQETLKPRRCLDVVVGGVHLAPRFFQELSPHKLRELAVQGQGKSGRDRTKTVSGTNTCLCLSETIATQGDQWE